MQSPTTFDDPNREPNGHTTDLRDLIASHPFFKELRGDHILALADCAMKTEFAAGERIFREGDPANRFFLILKGKVILELKAPERESVLVETIVEGDVLGWSWLVEPYVWHFDAWAVEATQVIFFYGTWLRELYEADGNLGYEMLKRVAAVMLKRLQAARRQLLKRPDPKPQALFDSSSQTFNGEYL